MWSFPDPPSEALSVELRSLRIRCAASPCMQTPSCVRHTDILDLSILISALHDRAVLTSRGTWQSLPRNEHLKKPLSLLSVEPCQFLQSDQVMMVKVVTILSANA